MPNEPEVATSTSGAAAALAMVYRSFGLDDCPEAIRERIASAPDAPGVATHRLAQDALEQGLETLTLQVHGDWFAVSRCLEAGARCVVRHRDSDAPNSERYSVLTDVSGGFVTLHDPLRGRRRLSCDTFLREWGAGRPSPAVPGQVMVAVARAGERPAPCLLCRTTAKQALTCPGCFREVRLQPFSVLGCTRAGCPMRSWKQVFCPWCDAKLLPARRPAALPSAA